MKAKYLIAIIATIGIALSESCLTFESLENKVLIDDTITLLIRNCGENPTQVYLTFKYLENVERKYISLILPNEIKYLVFKVNLPKGITKTLATIYAYNNETFISASFFLIKPEEFIKIEIPEIILEKDKQKEVFVKIKNDGDYEIEKTLELELPKGIIGYFEEEKVKIAPRSERNVKLVLIGKEEGEKEILIRFGNFEKIVKVYVREEQKGFEFSIPEFPIVLITFILIALLAALVMKILVKSLRESKDCLLPEI